MNVPFIQQWIAALRSDHYRQIAFQLYTGEDPDGKQRMCLMGVAHNLRGCRWVPAAFQHSYRPADWDCDMCAVTGLSAEMLRSLINRNNQGESFASLADYLESLLPRDAIPASVRAIFDVETEAA